MHPVHHSRLEIRVSSPLMMRDAYQEAFLLCVTQPLTPLVGVYVVARGMQLCHTHFQESLIHLFCDGTQKRRHRSSDQRRSDTDQDRSCIEMRSWPDPEQQPQKVQHQPDQEN